MRDVFGELRAVLEDGARGDLAMPVFELASELSELAHDRYVDEIVPYLRDKAPDLRSSVASLSEAVSIDHVLPWAKIELDLRGAWRSDWVERTSTLERERCRVSCVDLRHNLLDRSLILELFAALDETALERVDVRHCNITVAEVELIRELSPLAHVACGEFDVRGYALFPKIWRGPSPTIGLCASAPLLHDLDEALILGSVEVSIAAVFERVIDDLEELFEGAFDRFELSGQYRIVEVQEHRDSVGDDLLFEVVTTWAGNGFVDYDDVQMSFYFERVGDDLVLRLVGDVGFDRGYLLEL